MGRTGRAWRGICFVPAVSGVMACFPASEASLFPQAFSVFLRGKFLELNKVDVHGIQVGRHSGRWGVRGSEVRGLGPFPDLINA